jgi:hypothetical protein
VYAVAVEDILLDYRTRSNTPVAGFQLVRRSVLVPGRSSWDALEQNAEAEFWENRRLLEQMLDAVPRYLFDRAGFWACAVLRSYLVARGADDPLEFLVPNDRPAAAAARERFRLFGSSKDLPPELTVFDLSGEGLALPGLSVVAWPTPPLVPGLRIEGVAWTLVEQVLETALREKLGPFAVWFGADAVEAASLLRVSRKLNDGKVARIFIRDGIGSVRELNVWNRWDADARARRFGKAG